MKDTNSGSKQRLSAADLPADGPSTDPQPSAQSKGQFDPQSLFDMVAKSYDSWLRVVEKQHEDTGFSPFPGSDSDRQGPVFNYRLLEALERATSAMNGDLSDISAASRRDVIEAIDEGQVSEPVEGTQNPDVSCGPIESSVDPESSINTAYISEVGDKFQHQEESNEDPIRALNGHNSVERRDQTVVSQSGNLPCRKDNIDDNKSSMYLKEEEIKDLQEKVFEVFFKQNKALQGALKDAGELTGGHEQDDYDIEEILDALYDKYRPTHHIEVELNSSKDGSKRTLFNNQGDFEDTEGPSCEFTFEYDHNGKLIPTYNNVEEKLRQMRLGVNEIEGGDNNTKRDKKKKKKKKKKASGEDYEEDYGECVHECCLLCEYEAIYGERPRQMIKWYEQTMQKESIRRDEIRKKIDNAKLMAFRQQREQYEAQRRQAEQDRRKFQDQVRSAIEAHVDGEGTEEEVALDI